MHLAIPLGELLNRQLSGLVILQEADRLELTLLYIHYSHRPSPLSAPPAFSPEVSVTIQGSVRLDILFLRYRSSEVEQRSSVHSLYFSSRYPVRNLLLILLISLIFPCQV